jgi:hypothetical protein
MRRGAVFAVVAALASACGNDGEEGESTTSVADSGETGAACVHPTDDTVGPAVSVTIVNSALGVLWLGPDAFGGSGFSISDPGGEAFASAQHPCLPHCDDVDATGQAVCLDCDPEDPGELIRLEVGGRWTGTWNGGAWRTDDVACVEAQCSDAQTRADSCNFAEEVASGNFFVSVRGYDAATGCGIPSCDCTPDADGACSIAGTGVGPGIVLTGQLDFPNQTAIELTFDP